MQRIILLAAGYPRYAKQKPYRVFPLVLMLECSDQTILGMQPSVLIAWFEVIDINSGPVKPTHGSNIKLALTFGCPTD